MTNSSEEIVNKIINEQDKPKSLRIGRKGEVARFSRMVERYADELLSETLQALKEEIKKVKAGNNPQYQEAEYIRIDYVLQLIEDLE